MILNPEHVEKLPRGDAGEGYAIVAYTGANKIALNFGDEHGIVELANTTVPHAKAGDRLYFGEHGKLLRHVTKEQFERDGERVSAGTEQPGEDQDKPLSQAQEVQAQREDPDRFDPEQETDLAEGIDEADARPAGSAYDQQTLDDARSETSDVDTSKPLYGNTDTPSGLADDQDPAHPSVQDSNFVAGRTTHEQEEEAAAAPAPTPEDTPRGPTAAEQEELSGESEGDPDAQAEALRRGQSENSGVEGAAQTESAEQSKA